MRKQDGFTLLETVVALGVILAAMLTLAYTANVGFSDAAYSRQRQTASGLANQTIEQIRALPFDTLKQGLSNFDNLASEDNFDQFDEIWFDAYTFQAQAGRRYSIAMTSEDFDAYLILGSGSGEQFEEVARNDDSGEGYDSRIVFTPDATGTYTIRAASYDGEGTGAYALRLMEAVSGPFAVTPLSPLLMTARLGLWTIRGRYGARFLLELPAVMWLYGARAVGEMVGYAAGPGRSPLLLH